MITSRENVSLRSLPVKRHEPFVAMLPHIQRYLRFAFRKLNRDAREEAVQEGLVNALAVYARLCELGKQSLAYPGPLARYAAQQVRSGRQVAEWLNVRDITSRHCRQQKGIRVQRLDRYEPEEQGWREVLVEDRRAGPADTAAARIDFDAFIRSLSDRERRIALKLAAGEPTGVVAGLFQVSAARISQLRRQLMEKWRAFQGEAAATSASA